MSQIDRSVTNQQVIPVLASSVFADEPTARFACGTIAVRGVALPGLENEYAAHFKLRRMVYVDQTGQLAESDLQDDGTDRDDDDARAVTFALFENHPTGVRVIGVSRIIVRGDERPLPVEEFCPDSFSPGELTASSVEVSRVIARHERAAMQELVQYHLFSIMLAYLANHDMPSIYAIVEPWLERHVSGTLSISRIGDVRYVEHYLDYNVPIQVDLGASIDKVNSRKAGFIDQYRAAEPGMAYFGRATGTARERAA